MRLVSYVKNRIDYRRSDDREYFSIESFGAPKAAFQGTGIIYSWVQGVGKGAFVDSQFVLSKATAADYSIDEVGRISVEVESQSRFPCSGVITRTGEGYLIGPAIKLDPITGQNIVLMLITPRTTPYDVTVEKNVLSIPHEQADVTISSGDGEVWCSGMISGQSKEARIILNRNAELPVYWAGFNQTLTQVQGEGPIAATWKPVARSFEELLLALYPSSMGSTNPNSADPAGISLVSIGKYLGAPGFGDPGEFDDFVISDGVGVDYTLRLRIDRGLGRHDSDETRLTVT